MQKEFEPIQQLEARRQRLFHIIAQRESLVDKVGTGNVKTRSTYEAAIKVGRIRGLVRKSIDSLNEELVITNQQLEEQAYQQARNYLNEVDLRRSQLAVISELVAEGNLTEDDLRFHYDQFKELEKLPETNPLLQRGIDRVNREEEKGSKKTEIVKPSEDTFHELTEAKPVEEPKTYTLPNGRQTQGKRAQLLTLLTNASKDNPISDDQLIKTIYPDVDLKTAKLRLSVLKAEVNREILKDLGWNWVDVYGSSTIGEGDIIPVAIKLGSYIEVKSDNPVLQAQAESTEDKTLLQEAKPKQTKIDEFLQQLPEEQEEARSLLTQVRDSEDFRYAAEVISRLVQTDNQMLEMGSGVAGYLFETASYLYLQERLAEENKILLSPKETFEIFYILHPDRKKIDDMLQVGIEGISVPDGLVLTRTKRGSPRVDGACEYTLRNSDVSDTFKNKLTGIDNLGIYDLRKAVEQNTITPYIVNSCIRRTDKRFRGNLEVSKNPKLYIVLPQNTEPLLTDKNVKQVIVPISRHTFGEFINTFIADVQEKNGGF